MYDRSLKHGVMPNQAGQDLATGFLTQRELGKTKLRKGKGLRGSGARGSAILGQSQ